MTTMIDPDELKALVDAHENRLNTVWNKDRVRDEDLMVRPQVKQVEAVEFVLPDDESTGSRVEAVEFVLPDAPPSPAHDPAIVSRLDAIEQAIAALTDAVTGSRVSATIPAWLHAAVGDPQSYDVPDSARMSVKVRVLPNLYVRLEQVRARFGLQTLTGTWECLLRLGLAAAEHLPLRVVLDRD
jgi:hypothetical protein